MSPPHWPPARLGTQLGAGALLLVLAAWLFGAIAEDVVSGDRLTLVDAAIAQWLHRHATAPLTNAMLLVTRLHSTVAVACYATLAGLWLWRRRDWRGLTTVFLCVGGGLALNALVKLAFHRARPVFDEPLLTLSSYSFPSGHVAGSTILYGLGVAWVFGRTRRAFWRALAVVGALAMIVLVAFSRMYLGVHYLSDVAAAFAEGVAWLAICLSALAAFWRRAPVAA
jgi:membrane-associated phospholipid phosphatase